METGWLDEVVVPSCCRSDPWRSARRRRPLSRRPGSWSPTPCRLPCPGSGPQSPAGEDTVWNDQFQCKHNTSMFSVTNMLFRSKWTLIILCLLPAVSSVFELIVYPMCEIYTEIYTKYILVSCLLIAPLLQFSIILCIWQVWYQSVYVLLWKQTN